MYFVHARADFKAASTSLSILKLRTPIGGSTFLPASVISPNRFSRLTRSLFNSVQGLFRFLGVKHCILLPSISLCRLSIHPKQSASSTASRYQKCLSSTGRPRFTSTQHSLSLAWWASSHARNSLLLAIQRMLCSSINSDLCVCYFKYSSPAVTSIHWLSPTSSLQGIVLASLPSALASFVSSPPIRLNGLNFMSL